ncbi:MAG: hypothetical protein CM15mP45_04550 [Deltaproteobacteria bacterium]|nr:MAG: hypothetical protein CM15mP45_04550 [Deltaproteobacteria bacterium]
MTKINKDVFGSKKWMKRFGSNVWVFENPGFSIGGQGLFNLQLGKNEKTLS